MLRVMLVIGFLILMLNQAVAVCEEYRIGSPAWWECMEEDWTGPG